MSDFKLFSLDKKKDFLAKAKLNKSKKDQDTKRHNSIILVQKHIRNYLASATHASPHHPLLIRSVQQVQRNRPYVESVWNSIDHQPNILRKRVLTLTIESLQLNCPLQIKIQNFLFCLDALTPNQKASLSVSHFEFILANFLKNICQNQLIFPLYQISNFRTALEHFIMGDVHRLVEVTHQINSIDMVNQIIKVFMRHNVNRSESQLLRQEQSLQSVRVSFERILQMLLNTVGINQNDNLISFVLSLVIERLKLKYVELILSKYNIDHKIYLSPQFKQQIAELFLQKAEWKQFETLLLPLANLLGHFLSKFYKFSSSDVEPALQIVVEISKLNQSFAAMKLQNSQFFNLVQKLDSKFFLNKSDQQLKISEAFFIVMILKSYLELINDVQFQKAFRYDAEKLNNLIRVNLVRFMKNICMLNTQHSEMAEQTINNSIQLMSNLYNKVFRTKLVKTTTFEDPSMVVIAGNYNYSTKANAKYFNQLSKIVQRMPFLLPIQTRFLMFRNIINQNHHGYGTNGQVTIRRGYEFQDAFKYLHNKNLKGSLRVRFINRHGIEEQGIDAGGLVKEFLNRVFKVAFDPDSGLFVQNEKKELMPNPAFKFVQTGSQKSQQFEFVGQLLGKSLLDNIMLGVKFAGPFLNLLINKKNSFDDLLQIDADLYRSLAFIAAMQEGVEDLGLTFLYKDDIARESVHLVPRGDYVPVTNSNKMKYINLLINYKVNSSFDRQTWFIRKGLKKVINQKWIEMFNYAELNYLISGTGVIDVRDWRDHTRFQGHQAGLKEYTDLFWAVVNQMSEEEKSLLLKFVTSCERPSFLGFKDLNPPFTVLVEANKKQLPVSHTCSNILRLPHYPSKQILKEKLLYAIKSGAGFEFA